MRLPESQTASFPDWAGFHGWQSYPWLQQEASAHGTHWSYSLYLNTQKQMFDKNGMDSFIITMSKLLKILFLAFGNKLVLVSREK